ncbi:DUF1304 domain-containing protein [Staphylococcus kloosii]|uniref:DUF1304 domain-containing protein n=1 Tax=Staphylococcus kloosii TaxID=29384 RepID=UPI000D1F6E54|nr:DUF1304 domain-containing protein [Staphylococcus kloosii]PTJ74239.1 DUF1304 domain-containing protein [Staphylococcus kloosii]
MNLVSTILILFVAIEFLFIMYLETFITNSNKTSKIFSIPTYKLKERNINILLKNQGVYNGLIGLLLVYGVLFSSNAKELCILVLTFTIIVAIYGGITSKISIFFKQGTLPILALTSLLI